VKPATSCDLTIPIHIPTLVFILDSSTSIGTSTGTGTEIIVQSDGMTRGERFVIFLIEGCEFKGGQRLVLRYDTVRYREGWLGNRRNRSKSAKLTVGLHETIDQSDSPGFGRWLVLIVGHSCSMGSCQ
jgi:hypothetical protein